MNNQDIREICDTVKNEVASQMHGEICSLKECLVEETVVKAVQILNARYEGIVHELERKIRILETEMCYMDKDNVNK